jgi:hypothetical protein
MKAKRKAVKFLAAALMVTTMTSNMTFAASWMQDGTTGTWYHYDDSGSITTGWYKDEKEHWFYLTSDGKMIANSWFQDSDQKWYYLSESGTMLENAWVQDKEGKWYYVGSAGAMLTGGVTPDGYTLNQDGSWNTEIPKKVAIRTVIKSGGSGGSGGGSGGKSSGGNSGHGNTGNGNTGNGNTGGSSGGENPKDPDENENVDKGTPSEAKENYTYSIRYRDAQTKTILSEVVGNAEKGSSIEIEHIDIDGYEVCENQPKKMILTSNGKAVNVFYTAITEATPSEAQQVNWEVRFVDAETHQKKLSPTRKGKIQEAGTLYVNYMSKIVDGSDIWEAIEEPPIEITIYGPGDEIHYVEYELTGSIPEEKDPEAVQKAKLDEWLKEAKRHEAVITKESVSTIPNSRFYVTNQASNDIRVKSIVGQMKDKEEYIFYIIGKNFEPNGLSIPNTYDDISYSNLLEETISFGGDTYYVTRMSLERSYNPETCLHDWKLLIDTPASCLSRGTLIYKCQKCGKTETTYTPSLGHIDKDGDSICDRCNKRTFDQKVGSEISTSLIINGQKQTLTFVCIDEDYQGGMLYISKESIPLTKFGGYGNMNYEESNVRDYFHSGFQNDFSITGNSLMNITREESQQTDHAILLSEGEVTSYGNLIPNTGNYLVRRPGQIALAGIGTDGSVKNITDPAEVEGYGIRPAILLAKPDSGVPDSVHWNIGDVQAREIDGDIYMFRCIDQNYSDRTENHREAALFLSDSVLPADTDSTYEYKKLSDGSYGYVFKPGPIVNFGDSNDYKYSNIRKWLDKQSSNFLNTENINIGVDVAYMGSTEEYLYGALNESNLRPFYIGNQKLTGNLFILSIDEALKYRDYLWKFNGSEDENPESQYGGYSKAYWLRTPTGNTETYAITKQAYVVDLVNGNIHPNSIKPDNPEENDEELKVTSTVGIRPAFVVPQD